MECRAVQGEPAAIFIHSADDGIARPLCIEFKQKSLVFQGKGVLVRHTAIQKCFHILSFTGSGGKDDFADLWAVIMGLLRTDWFPALAASCVWQDDNGTREDVLSQAWKVRDRRVT